MERDIEQEVTVFRNDLRVFFRRQGIPYDCVEDLTQDVLIEYIRHLSRQAQGGPEAPEAIKCHRSYVMGIAKNIRFNWLEQKKRKDQMVSLDGATTPESGIRDIDTRLEAASKALGPEALLLSQEKCRCLWKCISELPAHKQTILILEMENLPQSEAARLLGISHANFRKQLSRTRQELTKNLRGCE